jgi:hypothetical protein
MQKQYGNKNLLSAFSLIFEKCLGEDYCFFFIILPVDLIKNSNLVTALLEQSH